MNPETPDPHPISPDALADPMVERCGLVKACRQRWSSLEPIKGEEHVRFCDQCQRAVFRCATDEEFDRHEALGRCVAIDRGTVWLVGRPDSSVYRTGAK